MLSERKWRNEGVIQLLLGLFATFCLIKLFWMSLAPLTSHLAEPNKKMFDIALGAVAFQGAALFWLKFFLRQQQLSWSEAFGFRSMPAARTVLIGLAAGVFIVPIAWILQRFSMDLLSRFSVDAGPQEIVKTFQESKDLFSIEMLRQQIVVGFSVILLAPVAEEMLFRGVLYPTFKQLGFPRFALWGTSVVFAMLHANLPALLPFILLAVVLVLVYETTDNLLAPIVTHAFFNAANFIYLVYESKINRLLTNS